MTAFKTLDDFDLTGKRVLLRVDLNVPVKDGKVTMEEAASVVEDEASFRRLLKGRSAAGDRGALVGG